MELSVLVVNYNTRALLQDCLYSINMHLQGKINFEAIVVDNASSDGSSVWLAAEAGKTKWLKYIASEINLGFAGGNNVGFPLCSGRYILLLNSDAFFVDDSVLAGIAYLESHPEYFGCGGHLFNADGSSGPSYGYFPGPKTLLRELLGKGMGRLRAVSPASDEGQHDIDFPCGAYFLIQHEHLSRVGLLDQTFFLYFEETDWAFRAWQSGLRIAYLPQCKAIHIGGGSSQDRRPLRIVALFYEGWRRYLKLHHPFYARCWVPLALWVYFNWRGLISLGRGRWADLDQSLRHGFGTIWGFWGTPSSSLRPTKAARR